MVNLSSNNSNSINLSGQTQRNVNVSTPNTNNVDANTMGNSQRARSWAIGEGLIDGEDYSAKHWAGQAKVSEEKTSSFVESAQNAAQNALISETNAKNSEEQAKIYATEAITGMIWLEINLADWVFDRTNNRYKYEINQIFVPTGVFKGDWTNKQLVNLDMTITDDSVILYTLSPFHGYILGSTATLTNEYEMDTVLNILDDIEDIEIVDITTT